MLNIFVDQILPSLYKEGAIPTGILVEAEDVSIEAVQSLSKRETQVLKKALKEDQQFSDSAKQHISDFFPENGISSDSDDTE